MSQFSDSEAEANLFGCCLLASAAAAVMLEMLVATDFVTSQHQATYLAIEKLYRDGQPIDTKTVLDQLVSMGASWSSAGMDLIAFQSDAPSVQGAQRYAEIIARYSLRRRIVNEATELKAQASDLTIDPGEALQAAKQRLSDIDSVVIGRDPNDETFEGFLARANSKPTPWVVPGLIRQGWRTVIVAPEGQGKTWLLRQIAVCAAYGIHPLTYGRIEPVSTLLVDLENPEDHIHESLNRLVTQAQRVTGEDSVSQGRLWHKQGGIDLRRRADRMELEALIVKRRPQLIIAGPLYKLMVGIKTNDTWELAAREIQVVLDDWRARYGVSYVLEDHAPQAFGGKREMRPYGSSLWLRWPEIGIGLEPVKGGGLAVRRWRGDRMPTQWPETLERGSPWPWVGVWPEGIPTAV